MPNPAQVVEDESLGDRPDEQFISQPMDTNLPSQIADLTVPRGFERPGPQPAVVGLLHSQPQSLAGRNTGCRHKDIVQ
jgi:hypothetical protein